MANNKQLSILLLTSLFLSISAISTIILSDLHLDPFYHANYTCTSLCRPQLTNWSRSVCSAASISLEKDEQDLKFSRFGCDSSHTLLDSLFLHLSKSTTTATPSSSSSPLLLQTKQSSTQQQQQQPSFVLVLGDFLAHGISDYVTEPKLSNEQVMHQMRNGMEEISNKLEETFVKKGVPVFSVLGNSDILEHNEWLPPESEEAKHLNKEYLDSVRHNVFDKLTLGFVEEFDEETYGYVTKVLPGTQNLRVLAFNSLLFSARQTKEALERHQELANKHLRWIDKSLERIQAQQHKVILISHVPFGVNPLSSLKDMQAPGEWVEHYTDAFLALSLRFKDVIAFQAYGHFHLDSFRVIQETQVSTIGEASFAPAGYMFIAPSISPLFHTNPAYYSLQMSPDTAQIQDIHSHHFDYTDSSSNDYWSFEYSFMDSFNDLFKRLHLPSNQTDHLDANLLSIITKELFGNSTDQLGSTISTSNSCSISYGNTDAVHERFSELLFFTGSNEVRTKLRDSPVSFKTRMYCTILHQRTPQIEQCLREHSSSTTYQT